MTSSSSHAQHSLLISDLHLCAARPDLNWAFQDFCKNTAVDAQALYILGDLSDAWVGDDDDSATAALIRESLSTLTHAGVAVYLMTGNRDFLMGEQLANDCNLTLLPDPSCVKLYGESVLLMHGDSLCTGDAEYMAFRAQIQNKQAQQMLLKQPLDQRRELAASLRAHSKSANSNKAEDIMDVSVEEVLKECQQHGTRTLIHGHTHRPAEHTHSMSPNGDGNDSIRRLVLGDWNDKGWYIKAWAGALELVSFPIATQVGK